MARDIVVEARNLAKQVSSPEGSLTIVMVATVGRAVEWRSPAPRVRASRRCSPWHETDVLMPARSGWPADVAALDGWTCPPARGARQFNVFPSIPPGRIIDGARERHAAAGAGRPPATPAAARRTPVCSSKSASGCLAALSRLAAVGGEQQRVALARASIEGLEGALSAIEPTGNLDSATGERIAELLFELNRRARGPLVVVTHDRTVAGAAVEARAVDGSRCARWRRAAAQRWCSGPRRAVAARSRPGRPTARSSQAMRSLRLALRALRREWRSGELAVLWLSLSVAAGALTGVTSWPTVSAVPSAYERPKSSPRTCASNPINRSKTLVEQAHALGDPHS